MRESRGGQGWSLELWGRGQDLGATRVPGLPLSTAGCSVLQLELHNCPWRPPGPGALALPELQEAVPAPCQMVAHRQRLLSPSGGQRCERRCRQGAFPRWEESASRLLSQLLSQLLAVGCSPQDAWLEGQAAWPRLGLPPASPG